MSENITVTGNKAQFNEDVVFLKDADIRGSILFGDTGTIKTGLLNIDGDLSTDNLLIREDLDVLGNSDFSGIVTARTGVDFGIGEPVSFIPSFNTVFDFAGNSVKENYGHLNVTGKYISFSGVTTTSFDDVGIGITQLHKGANGFGFEYIKLDVNGSVRVQSGSAIGIGTTNPSQSLHTTESVRISKEIYDSRNLDGDPGNFLSKDANGITWVSLVPQFTDGIFLMDESVYVPAGSSFVPGQIGAGQSFSVINFVERNSLGFGTDTTVVTARDPNSVTGLATVFTSDLWGTLGAGNTASIYRQSRVGVKNINPDADLDVTGTFHVTNNVDFDTDLNVDGNVTVQTNLDVNGISNFNNNQDASSTSNASMIVDGGVGIAKKLFVGGAVNLEDTLNVDEQSTFSDDVALIGDGKTFKVKTAGSVDKFTITSDDGNTDIKGTLNVAGITSISNSTQSIGIETGALTIKGGVGIGSTVFVGGDANLLSNLNVNNNVDVDGHTELDNLNVTGLSTFTNIVDLEGPVRDQNNVIANTAAGQYDYRLSSVGTGVSWRPSGVQTKRTIWVSKSGNDSNSGLLEGDAKATIGGAAAIAVETDTIKVRPGIYIENNPIGLRTDVTVTGEDLRLVIIQAGNPNKDIFHVRRGCLIENLNFGGTNVGIDHTGSACVAFPPPAGSDSAVSGYTAPGPATEGPSGRWRSPYVRNCTNFMTSSIGMRIDGDNATASTIGADLKSMVCDSFTQYNENGIGVSLTNDAYAQLVSIFTINTDIAIYASSGAQCDLTNSNSSFGNFGLVAVGLGSTLFTGIATNVNPAGLQINSTTPDIDTIVCSEVFDEDNNPRRPFDGQALFFQIDLDNYPDTIGSGRITAPLERLSQVNILPGVDVSGYSAVDPPNILIRDADGNTVPKGPQGIIAEATANVSAAGTIESVNVVAQGRNYLSTQNLVVDIEGNTGLATAVTEPIFFTVESATPPTNAGLTTITFNEFIPYEVFSNDPFSLQRISRILTSSHSFEYVGTGTDINIATPLQGAIPIKENEVVSTGGAQIPFTSTDQKGNFDIGEGIQIDQTTSTIRGRDFARAIQAEVTPLILALR